MIEPDTLVDGRYRILSRLGSGGMADVYLARDELLGREVAVKVLHHHFAEDQEFVERFRREASSAAALSHPNIVGIFDRGEWDGTYYIAMEYVAGRSLKAIVREEGALDPAVAIDVVIQILRAASFAHRRGVIHRDLKPHNVLLDEEGRARVTDFGIARAGASDMTMTGSIMGTAQYLSPEQAQGHAVSAASDLYSVGVILYELLTGVVPFEGETAVAIAYKQVSAEPRPPSELGPLLPASLDAVVLRALAKDPALRYASADELIAALQRERESLPALSGAALAAGVEHGGPPLAAAPATGPLMVTPALPLAEEAPLGPEQERRRQRRRRALLWTLAALLAAGAIAAALLLRPGAETVAVPNVAGQTEQAAGAALRRAGLVPLPSLAPSATVPIGLVIDQSPAAGSRVGKGSRVRVVVSGGPATVAVADVEGLSVSQALARLRKGGLKPSTRSQASSTVAAGKAIGTDPPAGTELQVGSPVVVLVSSGPATVKVPDVVGQSQAAAEATLANVNLAVGTVTKRETAGSSPGTVVSQAPATGSTAHPGDKVSLVLAEAPTQAEVPTVVGQGEAQAAAALGQAGFKPRPKSQPTSDASQVGIVLRQSPSAGTKLRKGATVTITIGVQGQQTTPTGTTPTSTVPTTPAPPPGG